MTTKKQYITQESLHYLHHAKKFTLFNEAGMLLKKADNLFI